MLTLITTIRSVLKTFLSQGSRQYRPAGGGVSTTHYKGVARRVLQEGCCKRRVLQEKGVSMGGRGILLHTCP